MIEKTMEERMHPGSVLILADIEGAVGVNRKRQCKPHTGEWRKARLMLTEDVNAAIRGVRRAGAREIHVKDMHGTGFNIVPERLEMGVNCAQGHFWKPFPLVGRVPRVDCAVMVGWHAAPDQGEGFSPHIFHKSVRSVRINGAAVTEVELFAAVLGEYGIPVVFLTADGPAVSRVAENMPWIGAARIPKGDLGPGEAALVRREIEEGVRRAARAPSAYIPLVRGRHLLEVTLAGKTVVREFDTAVKTLETILLETVFKAYPARVVPLMLPFYRAWCGYKASIGN